MSSGRNNGPCCGSARRQELEHTPSAHLRAATGRKLAATGGDGAAGGDVVLQACAGVHSLRGVPTRVVGGPGGAGGRSGRRGATGEDVVLRVPVRRPHRLAVSSLLLVLAREEL